MPKRFEVPESRGIPCEVCGKSYLFVYSYIGTIWCNDCFRATFHESPDTRGAKRVYSPAYWKIMNKKAVRAKKERKKSRPSVHRTVNPPEKYEKRKKKTSGGLITQSIKVIGALVDVWSNKKPNKKKKKKKNKEEPTLVVIKVI